MVATLPKVSLAELGRTMEGTSNRVPNVAKIRSRKDRDGFWVFWIDENGNRRAKQAPTRQAAKSLKRSIDLQLFLVKQGLVAPQEHEQQDWRRRPIAESVTDYLDHLRRKGDAVSHIDDHAWYLQLWIDGLGIKTLGELDLERTDRWLADTARVRGWSNRTYSAALVAIKCFANRMVTIGRLPRNPFLAIKQRDPRITPVRPSRAMTPQELSGLLEACPDPLRRLYYALAGQMGLRWKEIRRLRWTDVNLRTGQIELGPGQTKNKKAARLPIPPGLLEQLKAVAQEQGPIFAEEPTHRTWKRDLVRAGIVRLKDPDLPDPARFNESNLIGYETRDGRLDRKCLRKTFCTHIAMAGASPYAAQQLMRHQDLRLIAEVYTDPTMLELREVAARVASLTQQAGGQNCNPDATKDRPWLPPPSRN